MNLEIIFSWVCVSVWYCFSSCRLPFYKIIEQRCNRYWHVEHCSILSPLPWEGPSAELQIPIIVGVQQKLIWGLLGLCWGPIINFGVSGVSPGPSHQRTALTCWRCCWLFTDGWNICELRYIRGAADDGCITTWVHLALMNVVQTANFLPCVHYHSDKNDF